MQATTQAKKFRKLHRVGHSLLVVVHDDLVKRFSLDESVFTEQEALPDGSGIILKLKRLTDDFKEKEVSAATDTRRSPSGDLGVNGK
jgi:hypothetical protein